MGEKCLPFKVPLIAPEKGRRGGETDQTHDTENLEGHKRHPETEAETEKDLKRKEVASSTGSVLPPSSHQILTRAGPE